MTILIWPIAAIGWITNIIQRAAAAAARLGELLDTKESSSEYNSTGNTEFKNGDIIFKNVCFKYHKSSNRNDLENIYLRIPMGSSLGVIGSIGSGKSTFLQLLPSIISATEGKITIADVPICEYSLSSLRNNISTVPQDTFLFSATILDNIQFSRPDATFDEIEQAAKNAMLHEEILSFENGYDTMLGERGITLSGGQKQRTALARALLRKPAILILDDALSAVDANTEEAILANLKNLMALQTTIIASHRISSIMHCTNIIVLEQGKIIESGEHNELIKLNGYYKRIFDKQKLESEILQL